MARSPQNIDVIAADDEGGSRSDAPILLEGSSRSARYRLLLQSISFERDDSGPRVASLGGVLLL